MIRLLFSLLAFASPTIAEPVIISEDIRPDWLAVGRVNIGGFKSRALCSGALISPTQVLTAAHCVAVADGTPHVLAKVRFVAGWHKGDFSGVGKAQAITIHPDYGARRAGSLARIEADLAVITLQEPITDITPLPVNLSDQPFKEGPIKMLGYRSDRPHILTDYQGCSAYSFRDTMLSIDCNVVQGTSGSPVLGLRDGVWEIVGVVSSRLEKRGRDKALAPVVGTIKYAIETADGASNP